jgi:hypothetical protein
MAFVAAEIVAALYRTVLGRAPDPDGLKYYTAALQDGLGPAELADQLAASPEAPSGLARSPSVRALRRMLWTAPPLQGPPVYVLHIMKTGGTSLVAGLRALVEPRPCLTEVFLDDLVSVPQYVLDHVPLVAGHLGYEASGLLPSWFVTCVVLRDPVERTLSHYAHLRATPQVLDEQPDFSLEQFLRSPRWSTLSRDYQARQLAHEVDLRGAWVTFSPEERFRALGPPLPPEHPLPLQSLFDCSPLELSRDELLRVATERLETIEFVGVTEQLDSLFAAVARSWGIEGPAPLPRLQVSASRPLATDVSPELLAEIEEATAVDRNLYELARARGSRGYGGRFDAGA